jgi:uncharacterized protein YdaU (DUF1376 family)
MSAPYMPLFVSDYLSHTQHLSAAEHGAYMLLIMNYWQREKPLPADPRKLARIARMSDAEWAEASDSLSEFFQEIDGAWVHKRIEEEIAKAADKIEKAKANGKLGGRPPKKEPDGNPPVSGSKADAKLLDEMRLAEVKEDAASAASSASAPALDLIEAERRCREASGSDALGSFGPIAELLLRSESPVDLDLDALPVIRARPAGAHGIKSWRYYAPIIAEAAGKRIAKPITFGPPKVFVKVGTPEWDARLAAGHKASLCKFYPEFKAEGWFFR